MTRATEGDRRHLFEAVAAEVYEPLQRYFARRVPHEDVSELLDDVLLVIWRRLDAVPADHVIPWSYGVAKRCLANHARGSRRRLRLVGRLTEAAHQETRPAVWDDDADHGPLHDALADLPPDDRELIRLWAWERLEPREIAVVLGVTPNAVSLQLGRAKNKLRSTLERQNPSRAGHEVFGHRKEHGS